MIRTTFVLFAFALPCAAQLTLSLSPQTTFHRTNGDPGALDAIAIPIQSLGVNAGDWLRLRLLGDFDAGGSGDVERELVGVFAGNSALLASTLQVRVQAPATAGTAYLPSGGTALGNLPMDLDADFWIARNGFSEEVTIRVPAGAVNLFVAVPDSFFSDNSDPDADLGIELSLAIPPAYPGTGGEDLLLGTGVNSAVDLQPIKTAPAGALVTAALYSPLDVLFGNSIAVLVVDLTSTGTLPSITFPDTWFGANAQIPFATLLPSGQPSSLWSLSIPAGHAGTSVWIQGGALWASARNTLFVTSEAHEIRLQ